MIRTLCCSLLFVIGASQAHASAFDSLNDQALQASAYSLLAAEAEKITLTGDIHEGEKLSTIIAQITSYNKELEEVLFNGGDIEKDIKSNISIVDTKCRRNEAKTAAQCDLIIQYKPLGETAVQFEVGLDSNDKAVSISSVAQVARGD